MGRGGPGIASGLLAGNLGAGKQTQPSLSDRTQGGHILALNFPVLLSYPGSSQQTEAILQDLGSSFNTGKWLHTWRMAERAKNGHQGSTETSDCKKHLPWDRGGKREAVVSPESSWKVSHVAGACAWEVLGSHHWRGGGGGGWQPQLVTEALS